MRRGRGGSRVDLLGRGSLRASRNALPANYETSVAGDLSPFELRFSPIHVGYWRVERHCYTWDRSVADPMGDMASLVGRDSVSRDHACVRTAGRRHLPAFFFEILAPATSGNATLPERGCPLLVL